MNKEEKEKEYKSLTQKYIYKCAGKDTPSRIILQIFTTVVGLRTRLDTSGDRCCLLTVDYGYDGSIDIVCVVGVGVVGRHLYICLVFFLYFLLYPLLLLKEK